MIDIHCHILYGLDDGPGELEDAMTMLRMAAADGTRTIVATPHYNAYFRSEAALVTERVGLLAGALRREGLDISLLTGSECALDEQLLEDLQSGKCLTLAGSRYVLTELNTFMSRSMTNKMLSEMMDSGYMPIIAHVERLVLTKRDMDRIDELHRMGCLLQMNAETILQREKGWFMKWALGKVEDGTIAFIASDAHDTEWRKPCLREACDKVTRLFGARTADAVFFGNAKEILEKRTNFVL